MLEHEKENGLHEVFQQWNMHEELNEIIKENNQAQSAAYEKLMARFWWLAVVLSIPALWFNFQLWYRLGFNERHPHGDWAFSGMEFTLSSLLLAPIVGGVSWLIWKWVRRVDKKLTPFIVRREEIEVQQKTLTDTIFKSFEQQEIQFEYLWFLDKQQEELSQIYGEKFLSSSRYELYGLKKEEEDKKTFNGLFSGIKNYAMKSFKEKANSRILGLLRFKDTLPEQVEQQWQEYQQKEHIQSEEQNYHEAYLDYLKKNNRKTLSDSEIRQILRQML